MNLSLKAVGQILIEENAVIWKAEFLMLLKNGILAHAKRIYIRYSFQHIVAVNQDHQALMPKNYWIQNLMKPFFI